MTENRADNFLHMVRSSRRGRLKVYLGYCAGVGMTWQMLEEAHRLKKEGIDVVVGLVEAHGRAETAALVEGLEVMPRRSREYRGVTIEEMDAAAVLARTPRVVLVDELAHTNVPGSRRTRRYEDVLDLLAAGIHVISTLNLQHLESLRDTVEKIAGVKLRDSLPDSVISDADELVNVDLTAEDLRKRLEEGKIYPKERLDNAPAGFFEKANLEQLRELALREIASQIDMRSRKSLCAALPLTPDQVMVCLSSRGPDSGALLRYASRLAGRLNRNWYAIHVQTPSEASTAIDSQTQSGLSGTLALAGQLGAMVFTYKGDDIADTILRFAREYRVGHVVIGSPGPLPFLKRMLGKKNIVERLIENAGGITIVVLDTRAVVLRPGNTPPGMTGTHADEPLGRELPESKLSLSRLLSAQRIFIWNEPVDTESALKALVLSAGSDEAIRNIDVVIEEVLHSERNGSTFLNGGAAFPHVRVKDLPNPIISLGLTHKGVADVATDNPIEGIFLILSPAESPEVQTRILETVSRAAQNRYLFRNLKSARTSEEAFEDIRDWEIAQDRRTAAVDP